jgi:hypothetical protein
MARTGRVGQTKVMDECTVGIRIAQQLLDQTRPSEVHSLLYQHQVKSPMSAATRYSEPLVACLQDNDIHARRI